MKTAAVVFVVVFAGLQVDARALLDAASTGPKPLGAEEAACVEELNLDGEKIQRLNADDIGPEDDAEFNEFTYCYSKKKGLIKSNGDMDFDKIIADILDVAKAEAESYPAAFKLFKQVVTKSVEECRKDPPTGTTPGQTAIKTYNCIVNHGKDITGF